MVVAALDDDQIRPRGCKAVVTFQLQASFPAPGVIDSALGATGSILPGRPSVIPPMWRDDRCAPKIDDSVKLEGLRSYKFIYSGIFADTWTAINC